MHEADGPSDFISYPTNRVVATIAKASDARRALDALVNAGVDKGDIDLLHGDEATHRLDLTGEEHGFLAQFQRTLIRAGSPAEEYRHLQQQLDDVRAGLFVIMVRAPEHEKRDRVASIFNSHGARSVEFFGRWAWQSMDASPDQSPRVTGESIAGHRYETVVGGDRTEIRFESEADVRVSGSAGSSHSRNGIAVTRIRPGVWMLSWRDGNATTVQVIDLEAGRSFASITGGDGVPRHLSGTVQQLA